MSRIISIEYNKLIGYKAFWILPGLYAILMLLFFRIFTNLDIIQVNGERVPIENILQMDKVWHYLTWFSGFFHYLFIALIILLIGNEMRNGFWRMAVTSGLPRAGLLTGKWMVMGILSLFSTCIVLIVGYLAAHYAPVDIPHTDFPLQLAALFFLQAFCYMQFGLAAGVWLERTGLGILLILLYALAAEPLIGYFLPMDLKEWLPLNVFAALIPNPVVVDLGFEIADTDVTFSVAKSLAYCAGLGGLAYLKIRRMDL
jgi:ABC-type transport system involved in multi-copper enzyme maturation permease subunit